MKFNLLKCISQYSTLWITGIFLFCACSDTSVSDGGGSRGGNPVVVGMISDPDGAGASNVCVSLIDEDYSPLTDTLHGYITSVTTDSLGAFSIIAPDTGWYNVEAAGSKNGTRLIRFKIKTVRDSITVLPPDTLRMPGKIKVTLPEGITAEGACVYVPGTTIVNQISGAADTITLDMVPAGVLPVLYLCQKNSTDKIAVSHDVKVISDNTTVLHNWQWSSSRQIILNTGAAGAGTRENVYDFAVLIRLTSNNFDFTEAQDSGEDIRFSTTYGVQLTHEIEEWDAAGKSAAIWVKVDTVYGDNDSQSIVMYWGNPTATGVPGSTSVFDTASGYQGVWHFSDAAGNKVYDATVNNYTGISADTAIPQAAAGVAGKCRVFNGIDNYFCMPNTAESKLDFEENGFFTISFWASVDAFDGAPHVIVAKGYDQYFLRATGASSSPIMNFSQLGSDNFWQACTTSAVDRTWIFVTGVRQGNSQILYFNGVLVDSVPNIFASVNFSRNTSSDFSVGKYLKAVDVPDFNNGYCFFKGSIDEIRVMSSAQKPDWVKLCYMNQRSDDRLAVFK